MGWLGKVVGGAIGFALAGPVGAITGATIGYGYDLNETAEEKERLSAQTTVADTDNPYAVLGVSETASEDEIKQRYRKLVSDYHPDVIMAKGLPDEFIQFAHDKFIEIQKAYDQVKKERGMV